MAEDNPGSPEPAPRRERQSHELPEVVARLGWRYHHLGIPTTVARPGETHLARFGLHVCGFPTSPYGIEWMRFDDDSPLHPLIKTVPHVAFEVDDLDAALVGHEVIYPPGSPSEGVRAAMIAVDGAPVELIWFRERAAGSGAAGA
jgi:hypothetical protein